MLGRMIEPVAAFGNHLPVRIRFGEGVAASLADVLAGDGLSRPFLLLDRGLDGIPAIAEVVTGVGWVAGSRRSPASRPTSRSTRAPRHCAPRTPTAWSRSAAAP